MWSRLKTYFLTGLLVLAPVVATGYIIYRLFIFVDHLLGTTLRGGYLKPGGIPGIGFLTVLLIIVVTGALANNFLGRQLGAVVESLFLRVPFLRGIYSTLREIGEALLSERKTAFQRVVLVPYPSAGSYTIGLVTSAPPRSIQELTGRELVGVFIPTPPNPWTGALLYYPSEQVIPTDLRVDQAIKLVVSAGVARPSPEEDDDIAGAPAVPSEARRTPGGGV